MYIAAIVGIGVVILLALAVLCVPGFIRTQRMGRVAREYGLSYRHTNRAPFLKSLRHPIALDRTIWKENIVSGNVRGHMVDIFDSCQISGIGARSTHKTTFISIDKIQQKVSKSLWSDLARASNIKKVLEQLT